jgi:hypothetical protein
MTEISGRSAASAEGTGARHKLAFYLRSGRSSASPGASRLAPRRAAGPARTLALGNDRELATPLLLLDRGHLPHQLLDLQLGPARAGSFLSRAVLAWIFRGCGRGAPAAGRVLPRASGRAHSHFAAHTGSRETWRAAPRASPAARPRMSPASRSLGWRGLGSSVYVEVRPRGRARTGSGPAQAAGADVRGDAGLRCWLGLLRQLLRPTTACARHLAPDPRLERRARVAQDGAALEPR